MIVCISRYPPVHEFENFEIALWHALQFYPFRAAITGVFILYLYFEF